MVKQTAGVIASAKALVLLLCAVWAGMCSDDESIDHLFMYFGKEIEADLLEDMSEEFISQVGETIYNAMKDVDISACLDLCPSTPAGALDAEGPSMQPPEASPALPFLCADDVEEIFGKAEERRGKALEGFSFMPEEVCSREEARYEKEEKEKGKGEKGKEKRKEKEKEGERKRKYSEDLERPEEDEPEEGGQNSCEEERDWENPKKKRKVCSREEWKEEIRWDILEKSTVEDFEEVVRQNKEILANLSKKHMDDLEDKTGCMVGSLQWIRATKNALQAIIDKLGTGRERVGTGEDKEAEAVADLLSQGITIYEEELESRELLLKTAVRTHIPKYDRDMEGFYKNRHELLSFLKLRKPTTEAMSILSGKLSINIHTFRNLATTLRKGLVVVTSGNKIRDIKGDVALKTKIDKEREFRVLKKSKKHTQSGQLILGNIKNTLFYITIATLHVNMKREYHLTQKVSKNAQEQQLTPLLIQELNVRRKPLEVLCLRIESLSRVILAKKSASKESVDQLRQEIRELSSVIAASVDELRVIRKLFYYVSDHSSKYCVPMGTMRMIVYMEAIESYILGEAGREGGELEHVLRVLYRVMEKSGHGEKLRREIRGEEVKETYWNSSSKYSAVNTWLKGISAGIDGAERQVALLEAKAAQL